MHKYDERFASFPAPMRVFLTVLAIFFLAEAAVMLFLHEVLGTAHGEALAAIMAATLVTSLSAPFLWWVIVRPSRRTALTEHLRASIVVEHAVDGIITIDEQGLVESFNPGAERIFRLGRQEVLGKPLALLIPARYRDAHQQGLKRLRTGGRPHILGKTVRLSGLRSDGSEFPLELSLCRWETGGGTFYTGLVRDLTERKGAEEQLRLQETALQSAANAMLITDRDGRITWVNPAFTRLTGYTPQEALGQSPRLLKSGNHDQAFYRNLWETILSGQVWQREMTNRRKDGSLFTEEQTITPVRNDRGEITHFVSINHDLTERRRAEEALRESEARLRELYDEAPVGYHELDAEGRIVRVNRTELAMLGYSAEEMLGRPVWEFITECDTSRQAVLAKLAGAELRPAIERTYVRKDGTGLPVLIEDRLLRGPGGRITGIRSTMQDIGARKQAEEALRDSEERYRLLFESNPHPMWVYDLETLAFLAVNDAAVRHYGYSLEEFLAMTIKDIRPPQDIPELLEHLAKVTTGLDEAGTWRHRKKDGTVIDVEITSHSLPFGGRRAKVILVQDVTERKRVEETRQALYRASLQIQEPMGLQDRLHRLLETARNILHLDRFIVLLADREARWLEAVASTGTEEPLAEIRVPIGPEGGGLAQAYLRRQAIVWDGQAPVPEDLRLRPPCDQIKAFRSRVFANVPLVVDGWAIGVLGVDRKHSRRPLEPATLELLQHFAAQAAIAIENARLYEEIGRHAATLEERVQERTRELAAANQQLQEVSRHKSEFLANMSHELRTPLSSIIGFSEILEGQRAGPLTGKQVRYVGHIHQSGNHLLQLINDILDLSKVEAGKLTVQPEPLAVTGTLEDILAVARELANKKTQTLKAQIQPDLPPVWADPVRFKQICFNLLSNAVKFTPDHGRISVTARRVRADQIGDCESPIADLGKAESTPQSAIRNPKSEIDEWLEIAIKDTGIGIKAKDLPRLFQEFVQLEAASTKQHEGTGLGLALTKRLVKLHGGRIWAESGGEGHGARFTVRLPFRGSDRGTERQADRGVSTEVGGSCLLG